MVQTASIQRGGGLHSEADEARGGEHYESPAGAGDLEPASTDSPPPPPPSEGVGLVVWRLGGLLLTMRPHQWVKNVFVLAPVVFAREMFITDLLVRSIGAFGVFCLLTGAVYTMNDLVDIDNDATHPIKRYRPIPSGRVPISWARTATVALVVISLAGAAIGPWEFLVTALCYFLLNVAYSFKLKQIAYLDVGAIAAGFVLRVLAGGFATHTEVSTYLTLCTALLALFLGLGKRRHELSTAARGMAQQQRAALGGYTRRGLRWSHRSTALLTVASYVAYTLDPMTMDFFHSRHLWLTSVFVLGALWRFMVLVRSRPNSESPTQEMLRDGPFVAILFSWGVVVLSLVYNFGPN
ncbi:MAG: prenyltransferase UbiA [Pseudomonadota bacterium]|jgi:4-hydroxybenzoate polyprenyltransferase